MAWPIGRPTPDASTLRPSVKQSWLGEILFGDFGYQHSKYPSYNCPTVVSHPSNNFRYAISSTPSCRKLGSTHWLIQVIKIGSIRFSEYSHAILEESDQNTVIVENAEFASAIIRALERGIGMHNVLG